jgi:hypothetical protein
MGRRTELAETRPTLNTGRWSMIDATFDTRALIALETRLLAS